MPVWFFDRQERPLPFKAEAKEQFLNGLAVSIANKDLLDQATLFYERGNHHVSLRYLTPEQVFVKAYGCLFGVEHAGDKSLGVRLMESILGSYGSDEEFLALQKQVAYELLKHLYRTNEPELLFTYLRSALQKGYDDLFTLLSEIYQKQWHSELLQQQSALSMALFAHFYRRNFGSVWQTETVVVMLDQAVPMPLPGMAYESDAPHIGKIDCDGQSAYFRKSKKETRVVELVIDGRVIAQYDVYASYGDVYTLFLAYDAHHRVILTLHSDFDHYGPESCISLQAFRNDPDGVRAVSYRSDWVKGLRRLPYGPYTFAID